MAERALRFHQSEAEQKAADPNDESYETLNTGEIEVVEDNNVYSPEAVEAEEVFEDHFLKAKETSNAIIEKESAPHGQYSLELGEGGKKQQDSLAAFTVKNEQGENETWLVVADGVSSSKDGAESSSRLIQIVQEKIQTGQHPREAMAEASRQFTEEMNLEIAKHTALAAADKTLGKKQIDLTSDEAQFNPLLCSTFVATRVNENGSSTAFLLGDGQVYVSRTKNSGAVEKIQRGEMKPVDYDDEKRSYNNDIDLELRRVLQSSVQGSIDLVKLYNEGKIQLTGQLAKLQEAFDKARVTNPDGSISVDVTKLNPSTQAFLERFAKPPEEQAAALKEMELGTLEPGDVVLICSDGIENNILATEIQQIIDKVKKDSKNGIPDPNAIRGYITKYVQNIIFADKKNPKHAGFVKKYAKTDNFSLIVYVQTEKGTERLDITDKDIEDALKPLAA